MRKSQVSVEFIMLAGFMFLIFILFFVFIQDKRIDFQKEHHFKTLEDVSAIIDSEIKLGMTVQDNYLRNFTLPPVLLSKKYNMTLLQGKKASKISIKYADGAFNLETFVNVPKNVIIANITAGNNVIYRRAGIVVINNSFPS